MDGEALEESTETTLIIDDLLLEEISQVAQENNAIRVPTRENPLRVTTIGDSVAYDADPGIKALIEATEMAEVENRSFGGVGLTQNGFEVYLEESLANKPEVVTVMVGGWDLAFAKNDQEKYSEIVESSFEKILEVASLVIVIGMPPTPDTEGLEENRYLINRIYKNISNLKEEIIFIDTNRVLGDENGKFTRNFKTFDGEVHQIRKVRDGKDDGHLCPFGAVLIGESVFAEISRRFPIPHTTDAWWSDNWVNDQRYDDPPGGCEQTSVN